MAFCQPQVFTIGVCPASSILSGRLALGLAAHDVRQPRGDAHRDAENLQLPMMGARTLVDMMILEKIGDLGVFKEKLKELEKEGFVGSSSLEALYSALEVGNAAAHRGHAATESEVQAVMDIVETMLQSIYVFPDLAQNLRKTTPPRIPRPQGS